MCTPTSITCYNLHYTLALECKYILCDCNVHCSFVEVYIAFVEFAAKKHSDYSQRLDSLEVRQFSQSYN